MSNMLRNGTSGSFIDAYVEGGFPTLGQGKVHGLACGIYSGLFDVLQT